MVYCRRCGEPLTNVERHIFSCVNKHTIFAAPSPTVGIFFFDDDTNILLSVRGIEPHIGMLDSIGGFVDKGETLETAIEREIEEELGLSTDDYSELIYLTSAAGNYPYQGDVIPVLSSFFYAWLKPNALPVAQDDVASLVSLPLHEIDFTQLHDDDIRGGVIALQKKFPPHPNDKV